MRIGSRGRVFGPLAPGALDNVLDTLRAERSGAVLLFLGASVALLWANSPWREAHSALSELVIGPAAWHLDLTVREWATDGLLAVFFFVVGLELKREMVDGQLRRVSTAIVPIFAAIGGMVVPAAFYLAINATRDGGTTSGWAVPIATDIAFAVAVLTVFGSTLPTALRAFLLTLAVADDLLGIIVIAVFYADALSFAWLAAAGAAVAVFAALTRRPRLNPGVLITVALAAWAFVHASGVHATIAGVALGLVVPAVARAGERASPAERLEHLWRPVSAAVAVPLFALFASGVVLSPTLLASAAADPAALGVFVGLVLGKPVGILTATAAVVLLTRARLDPSVRWPDLAAVSCVAGIGFTVSLLIGGLSFEPDSASGDHVKVAVLFGSLTAAAIGAALLRWRSRPAMLESHPSGADATR